MWLCAATRSQVAVRAIKYDREMYEGRRLPFRWHVNDGRYSKVGDYGKDHHYD